MTDSDQQKTVPIFKNINLVPYTGSLSLGGSRFSKIHGSGPQIRIRNIGSGSGTPAPIPFFTDLRDGKKINFMFFSNLSAGTTSVADPGCLSRILIFTHPGSRIQKQQHKRGVKKNLLS
jgi:hypothetical protein